MREKQMVRYLLRLFRRHRSVEDFPLKAIVLYVLLALWTVDVNTDKGWRSIGLKRSFFLFGTENASGSHKHYWSTKIKSKESNEI